MEPLTFDWADADAQWDDPLTGTRVVRLSPATDSLNFRTDYFRIRSFTSDGRSMTLVGKAAGDAHSRLFVLDLHTGAIRELAQFQSGSMGIPCAVAPHARVAHLVVREGDHEELERVDLDTGERRRVRPSRDFSQIYDPGCSADGRFVFTPDNDAHPRGKPLTPPPGMTLRDYRRSLQDNPGVQRMYRIDLETGQTDELFHTDAWNMGHPNPNHRRPELFMCCQETGGRRIAGYQRVRVFDREQRRWLDTAWPFHTGGVSHEMWSEDGQAIWGHGGYLGYQNISVYRLSEGRWRTWIVPIGAGDSAHVHPAPDESFLVGDGKNFGWNTEDQAAGQAASGGLDHAFDGVGCHSMGEVIWKFELPEGSLIQGDDPYHVREDLTVPVYRNPDKVAKVKPICRFRSMMRRLNKPMRLESNAHVTPDSRWVTFTSSGENNLYEIWAARVVD